MKSLPQSWPWWSLSVVLSAGVILAWPDVFLFSKVVHLPDWVHLFPDPWVAAWLLLLVPFALALPGAPRFKPASARLLGLAVLGTCCGVVAQTTSWPWNIANSVAQIVWVFVTCSLPPVIVLRVVAAIRSRYAAGR